MKKFTHMMTSGFILSMIAALSGCSEEEAAAPPPAPLTVGGIVTGLSGSGLVLQLNNANNLTVNANGKFNFPKALNKGSAYAVTVLSSPSAPVKQTCTVNRGSGAIADTAVSSIAVTCTTNSYAVGGLVSGLSGKGLALQLNGANDLVIEKSGKFLFPGVRLPDGGDYSVAIKTMPVKQLCKIEPINTARDSDTINIVSVTCSKKGHN